VQLQMARFSDQTVGTLQVAGAGVLIGTLGVCVREAGQSAWVTVWFRCVVGAVTVSLLASQFGWRLTLPRNGREWLATLACGLLMTLTWVFFFASLDHLSIGVATVVFQVQPLILMACSVMVLHERASALEWTAAVAALVGIALVALPPLRASVPGGASALTGFVLCIGAAACFTGVTLIARRATVSPQGLAWSQCVVGAVCLSWAPLVDGLPSWGLAWAWLVDLGAVHTGLAYVLLYAGIRRTNTVQIALLQFVSPIAAVLVDWCVYKQLLQAIQLVGLVLTIMALAAAIRSSGNQSRQADSLSRQFPPQGARL
jgi:drug/metabolite transporter (DMT)-like permease